MLRTSWTWTFAVFGLALMLVVGGWLVVATGSVLGFAIASVAGVALIGMWIWRARATKNALWTLIEALIAYVTGAWFWDRRQ
jgi:hypothetical protein